MLIFWAVLGGFVLDAIFADPAWLPHPVVMMGRCISALEKRLRAALPTTPQDELLGGLDGFLCRPCAGYQYCGGGSGTDSGVRI